MKILLLYATWGWGHKKAAEALKEAAQSHRIQTSSIDLLEFLPSSLAKFYSVSYSLIITEFRTLWRWIYQTTDGSHNGFSPGRSIWQAWQFDRLRKFLYQSRFDAIVSTHFLTSALLADWREMHGLNSRLSSVVTDFTAHRYWKKRGLDHYFVATAEVARDLAGSGLPPDRITVSGIPVSSSFYKRQRQEDIRNTLGISNTKKLILVLTSGLNAPRTKKLINQLRDVDAHFLVSAGKDAPKEESVRAFCRNDKRFKVFGISPDLPAMMQASDLLISKPGGVSSSEALATPLPMILLPPIPGQEEGNARVLTQTGAAVQPNGIGQEFSSIVQSLLSDDRMLESMKLKARRLGKPQAAITIIETILNRVV